MARPSNAQKLADIHKQALAEFDDIQEAHRLDRMMCLSDRRFYSVPGAQWEGDLGEQFANRPRLEFNDVHLAVIRIINEYRNNRVTVDFTPRDGSPSDELADVCDGLYRADERDSGAQEAYDNAFEEGVGGGFGAWRLRACYEDDEDDEDDRQRVRIEPIYDADSSVFFDLDAKRQDKSDATRCFVITAMSPAAFKEQYGHDAATWDKDISQAQFDWCTPEVVHVAEYYRIEETSEVVRVFRGLDDEDMQVPQSELDADDEKLPTLLATGFREVRQKRKTVRRVHKYILSGIQVEEDCGLIAGKHIPIVPYYGKRWYVDGVERCMGHVRLAKDAQRLKNSLLSWLTEITSRFDVEKPIFTPEQVLGHAQKWADDNINRYPYLLVNSLRDASDNPLPAGPIAYTKAPNVPPAMAALIQVASESLQSLLGRQEAGEEMQSNISGKVVELVQQRLDMQTFIYMSNFAKAMKRSGEIWLSMAADLLVEEGRKMKTIKEDGTTDSVTLLAPGIDPETNAATTKNDLSRAKFDVWVDVGPSSSSKRAATVRALTGVASITDDPADRKVLLSSVIENMEGEGLAGVRKHFRRQGVQGGWVEPTKQEAEEMAKAQQNQQPDPQSQYLLASAEQTHAKTLETLAATELKNQQAAKTAAEIAAMGAAPAPETPQPGPQENQSLLPQR